MIIKMEDVVGVFIKGELFCLNCLDDDGWNCILPTNILASDAIEKDKFYFCDECGMLLCHTWSGDCIRISY